MASSTLTRVSPAQNILRGTTITELEQLVERTILDARPPMSLAQIRILLRVWDACEVCDATGRKDGVRCAPCQGKGYRDPLPPLPTASEWDRFESDGAPDEPDWDREAEERVAQ